jgi:anion-transporting  ArsA/GET3 family ATPase
VRGITIVAGKGGVGKTTVAAVLAVRAADAGLRVLVVELDGKPALSSLLDGTAPKVHVRSISAADALEEYLFEHGFRRIARRLATTGVIDVVSTAAPGIDDLVVLGKIKQLDRTGEWDAVIVDGPAAGHAITFLTSSAGLRDAVSSGPVRTQADEVLAMLGDRSRCRVVLVTTPETTPINELLETGALLRQRVDVAISRIVVNQVDVEEVLPDPDIVSFGRARAQVDDVIAAARFRRRRQMSQSHEIDRLRSESDVDCVIVPFVVTAELTASDIAELARSLAAEDAP